MHGMKLAFVFGAALVASVGLANAAGEQFVAAWTASANGPYPLGAAVAFAPEMKFALPSAEKGASDQTFRMIVRPDIWGPQARIRLSNAMGKNPVTFDGAFVGLQNSGSAIVAGTNRKITFGGKDSVTVGPGKFAVSDDIPLPFVKNPDDPLLVGRNLAVSFHVVGDSGPMTFHKGALTTSYLTPPGAGSKGAEEAELAFPFSTVSWFFLDAVEMFAPAGTKVIVAFGDSITDGTSSTLNGNDRWPDVFARLVHASYGNRYVVVNEGIGGNQVAGPADFYTNPVQGGPPATERLQRDVISLPGVADVIWLEGINDFGNAGASVDTVTAGIRDGVKQLRAGIPGVRIFMATVTSSLNSTTGTNASYGTTMVDEKRRALNKFIRTAGIFDGIVDFDTATLDPKTGELKAPYQFNTTIGAAAAAPAGDKLHPNRAGYAAMAAAIDLRTIAGE